MYGMGYAFGIDKDVVYDFLLGVGDAINATGQEVVKRKVKAKIVFNKYLVFKIKVTLECGSVMKFKHVEPINVEARLVRIPDDNEKMPVGDMNDLKKQLEALGMSETTNGVEKEEAKNKIGFATE